MSYEETSDWDSVPDEDVEDTFCYAHIGFADMTEEQGRKICDLLYNESDQLHWEDDEAAEIMLSLPWRSYDYYCPGKNAAYGIEWCINGDERETLDALDYLSNGNNLDFDSPYGHVEVALENRGVDVNDDDDESEEDW